MDQTSAQTEKISTYETSRTRRSIVDGNINSDDSNNDEEYASSGFYVREKTTDKKQDSTNVGKENNKESKENGLSAKASSLENGENSEDGESSRDSKKDSDGKEEGLKSSNEKVNKQKKKEDKSKEKDMEKAVKEKIDSPKESNNGKEHSRDKKSNKDSKKDKSLENTDGKEEVPKISNEKVNKQKRKDDKSKEKKIEKAAKEITNLAKESNGKEHSKDRDIKDKDDSCPVIEIKTEKLDENETEKIKQNTKNDKGKKQDKEIDNTTTNGKEDSQQDDTKGEDPKQKACPKTVENKTDIIEKTKDNENKGEKVDAENSAKEQVTKAKIDDESDNTIKTNSEEHEKNKEAEIPNAKKDDKREDGDTKKDEQSEESILKGQLEKNPLGNGEENVETEMEMDEDFDPSLLCPDISMDVDEAPVITSNPENIPDDGSTSPLPYEATYTTLVDEITGAEVQVDLTPEEMELRQQMYGPNNPVQKSKIHCTACNIHLGSALTGANNRFVHPLLKVLICKNCYHFYTSGEFEKDEDGSELYCRWCGQGGQVLCCSSCEFVFCKRCIRNNFGPKKFKEIRDSDDWNCFRCDRVQLSSLRASCAEFMEYYRTELARAQSLSQTHPELMTTDHTNCCKPGSEKKDETKTPTAQKGIRKKRKDDEDPDYHPVLQDPDEPPKKKFGSSTPSGGPGYTIIPPANSVKPIQPRPPQGVRPQGQNVQNQGQVFKVGNTTFRAKAPSSGPGYTIQRPTVNPGQKSSSPGYITIPPSAAPKTTSPGYITIPPSAAPKTTSPGYIKILPQRMQGPRPTSSYTVVSGSNNGKPTFTTVRPKQAASTAAPMKHEWFEKTVRAAARVNSNLSYTLTQLNRQQSQATSVEGLAMVHNKLQEVLSTSINSLIQIRKNLRTEFIAGIKNIKFPPKPAPIPPTSGPIVVKDDDDVIFVSTPKTTASLPPPPPLILSPSVTLTKKTPIQKSSDPFENPQPSTSGISANKSNTSKDSVPPPLAPVKGGFLKVRSFTSLQTVPSECITIPDDPPPSNENVEIVEEEDPLKFTEPDTPKVVDKEPKEVSVDNEPKKVSVDIEPKELSVDIEPKEVSVDIEPKEVSVDIEPKVSDPPKEDVSTSEENMVYNTNEDPSPAIKRMMGAHVLVKKSRVIDEIFRAQGMFNGKDSKTKTEENESIMKEDSKKEEEEKKGNEKNEEKKENDKNKEKKENDKTEKKQEEKIDEKSDDNMETEEDENKKEKEGETAEEESKTSETA